MGLRVGLDGCGKAHLAPGFDPRPSTPIVSRYAVCPIPVAIGLAGTAIQACALVTECRLCSCISLMNIARRLQRTVAFTFCQLCAAMCVLESRCVLLSNYVAEVNRLKT